MQLTFSPTAGPKGLEPEMEALPQQIEPQLHTRTLA